jgi:hypothetical protein
MTGIGSVLFHIHFQKDACAFKKQCLAGLKPLRIIARCIDAAPLIWDEIKRHGLTALALDFFHDVV